MTKSRYEAILFDWDDTLCYADPHRYHHAKDASKRLGHDFSMEEIYLAFARADHTGIVADGDWFGAIAHELGLHSDHHPAFRDSFDQRNTIKRMRLFEDAVTVLNHFHVTDIRIGLLSNNRFVKDVVQSMQVEHHFEVVVSPDTYGVGKPEPEIFERTLEDMDLQPDQILYVGDSYEFDVIGARAAGVTPVLVNRFDLKIDHHSDAEHHLSSLEELHNVLASQSAGDRESEDEDDSKPDLAGSVIR